MNRFIKAKTIFTQAGRREHSQGILLRPKLHHLKYRQTYSP